MHQRLPAWFYKDESNQKYWWTQSCWSALHRSLCLVDTELAAQHCIVACAWIPLATQTGEMNDCTNTKRINKDECLVL